jgi:hypothetical protein
MLGVTPYHDTIEPDPAQRRSWALALGELERVELS